MKKFIPLLFLLFVVVGCRTRLNDESDMKVKLADKVFRTVDPISKEQTVNFAATATSGQFSAYVFLEKDKAEVEKAVDSGKDSPKVIQKDLKTTKATLSATVPANERVVIMVLSGDGKDAEVKVKITN